MLNIFEGWLLKMMTFTPKNVDVLRGETFKYFPNRNVSEEFDSSNLENTFHRLQNDKLRYKGFAEVYFPALDNLTPDEKSKAWDKFIDEMYTPYELLQEEIVEQFQKICFSHSFATKGLREVDENLKNKIFSVAWGHFFNPEKKWSYIETDIQNFIVRLIPFLQEGLLVYNK